MVRPLLSGAVRAYPRGVGTGVVSARAYRLLFWLGLLLLVIVALGLVQSILLPFAAGFVIAYVLAPMVALLERRGGPPRPRSPPVLMPLSLPFSWTFCFAVCLL